MSDAPSETIPPADPKAPDFLQDPHPFYNWLRRNHPVYLDPRHDIYFVGRHDLAEEVFKNPELFSTNVYRPNMRQGGMFKALQDIKDQDWPPVRTITQNDDVATHDTYRGLVSHFFAPRTLAGVEPFVREKTNALLSALEAKGGGDFVAEFAVPLPISVIGQRLGLDGYGEAKLKQWSDAFADEVGLVAGDERALEAARLVLEAHRRMLETAAARRLEPKDDIITHLVQAALPDGSPLSEPVLISMLTQLLVAGNETTTNMLGFGVRRFATDPELFAQLKAEPQLLSSFIEELLRVETPVQGQFRRATRDCTLGGVSVPKDALLHVRLASANRDEAAFGEQAQCLHLGVRRPKQHLAFGVGMHFCLGAMLSRLEMRIAFSEILRRWDELSLAVPESSVRYRSHFSHRGLAALPIRLGAHH